MEHVGTNIKTLRKKLKYTQKELAEMAEISNTYLSDIEVGRTSPSLNTLYKISIALGCDVKELL